MARGIRVEYPGAFHHVMAYAYEPRSGRLSSMTDAKGQVANYSYFLDSDLQQIGYANAQNATPSVSYVYDPDYNRRLSMTDGTGLTTYGYNPITTTATLGAGRLASVDGPLANDMITYGYDELGRLMGRSIDGAADAASLVYDALGRVQSATNPLGAFAYSYVNATGRMDHVDLPGGQRTQYAYFDNLGDARLQQIKNLNPSGGTISEFDYLYNQVGDITSWTVQQGGVAATNRYDLGYDAVDQLRSATLTKTNDQSVLAQNNYDYDEAGNRSTNQNGSVVTSAVFNELNQLIVQSGGGKMHFRGTVDEPATVTVGGKAASVDAAGNFDGVTEVTVGSNTVPIIATDGSGNSKTNNYQLTVTAGANQTLSYDANGNLTADGSQTYEWDAANRLTAINYSGTSNRTELNYDGLGRRTKIVEKTGATINSTKKFVWDGLTIAEERDGSNQVTRRHYPQGVQFVSYNPNTSTPYFHMRDHLGSVREMTDTNGVIQARYDYDPWGNRNKLSGGLDADFGFTGHYYHAPSDLNLAPYRAYDATVGRWLSRDPIGEIGGINLYGYVSNNPTNLVDPLGLFENGADLIQWGRTLAPAAPAIPAAAAAVSQIPLLPITGAAAAGAGAGYLINQIPGVSDAVTNLFYNTFYQTPSNGPGREALERNREFRRWFHRNWKPSSKKRCQGQDNPNADDDELDEAYADWLSEGRPSAK